MSSGLVCIQPWDSSHFGLRIARAIPRRLDQAAFSRLEADCVNQGIDCLYFLADAADQATIATLQAGCFDLADIRLTLDNRVRRLVELTAASEFRFRLGRKSDLEALLPIAGASYMLSRFYTDMRFGSDKASLMYQVWLTNSLTAGYADAVIVAEFAERPVGFVTCHLHKPHGEANLGLVGVAESVRGMGCMSGMLHFAGQWLSDRGIGQVNVVTQGKNIPAQRAYQRCGFVSRSVELWFHKWFQRPVGAPLHPS